MTTRRLWLSVSLVLGLAALEGRAQTPTFSIAVDAVPIDVLVTDRGRVVRGLVASDFEVLDNGVPQQIDLVSFEQLPLNLALTLDLSASVAGETIGHLRTAGEALLTALVKGDQAMLLTFSHRVALPQRLTTETVAVRGALAGAQPSGDTALRDGAYAALTLGDSDTGRNLALLFSDGVDTSSWLSADQVLESAKRSNVVVYGVTPRGSGSGPFLRDLSEQTGGSVVEIDSTKDLQGRFVAILQEFRQRYLLSFTPRGIEKAGWHRLTVRVKGRRATVRARTGYFDR